MIWSAWLVGLMACVVAIGVALGVRPPPRDAWIRRIPLRSIWRILYVFGAGVVVLMIVVNLLAVVTGQQATDSRALPGYFLFALGFGYVFLHAFKHSAVIISENGLFVYPLTVRWSESQGVVTGAFGVRVRRKGRWAFADIPIPRMMYPLTAEDVALIESRARAV